MIVIYSKAGRKRSTLYNMKNCFPQQYRLLAMGALSEMVEEAKQTETERMTG